MNQLQIMLSSSYKLLKLSIAIGCFILAICLLSASTLSVAAQSSDDEQTGKAFIGEDTTASYQIPQGKALSIPVTIQIQQDESKIGAISVRVSYDPELLEVTGCINNPDESIELALCNYNIADEPGVVRMNGVDSEGMSGTLNLAILDFHALGTVGDQTDLKLEVKQVTDLDGNNLDYPDDESTVEITDASVTECTPTSTTICSTYRVYLPTILK